MSVMYDTAGNSIGIDNPLPVKQVQSDIILPVDIQSRLATTIQTHNAVSIALSGGSTSSWIDTDGFDKIALSMLNDSGTVASYAYVEWSPDNGTSVGGLDTIIASGNGQRKSGITDTKLRYVRVTLANQDSALAHTMSAWAYLKA